jgi:response regulator of citrate/malate metabolism
VNKAAAKMVVGETQNGSMSVDEVDEHRHQEQMQQQPSQISGLNQATIDNIMSGIENTGAVKMNNHRKKLRQR